MVPARMVAGNEARVRARGARAAPAGSGDGSGQGARARPKLPIYFDERNRLNVIRDTQEWLMTVAVLKVVWKFARKGAWAQVGFALGEMLAGLRNERGPPAWVAGK